MKKYILATFIVLNSCYALSQTIVEPQKVDTLWYVWAEYSGQNTVIYCSFWNGLAWTKPYQLTDSSSNSFTPAIAIDNNKNPWIVWVGWDGIKTSIYSRHYDGKNWSAITQVDDVDIYSDTTPAITIDKDNIPWVAWAGTDGADDDIYTSHWNGRNWASPQIINNDNAVPDVMPVITSDNKDNIIIIWCGFDIDRYKLFYSQRLKNKWSEQRQVIENIERFSVDLPGILRRDDNTLQLFWYEKRICFKSTWSGTQWSVPESGEILLPKDFFMGESIGPAYISWIQDGINQSLRVVQPAAQKTLAAYSNKQEDTRLGWFVDFLCSTAYAAVEENKYIAFGDSITEGVGASDRSSTAYPPRLEEKLDTQIGQSTVVNEGVGGERTFEGLARIDDVLNAHNARFILIMEGTNDVTYQFSTDTIMFNLGEIVEHAKNFGTTPLLATLTPRLDFLNDRIDNDINPNIITLASQKGVTLVDQYTEMNKDAASYMSDGRLHPNDDGYELMAEIWFNAINNILNPSSGGDNGGCGIVPPIYKRDSNNNLLPLLMVFIFIIFLRLAPLRSVLRPSYR